MVATPTCVCGERYSALKTGLTFTTVRQMMHTHTEGAYRNLARRGVLGFWRELKLQMWESLHGHCTRISEESLLAIQVGA